MPATKRCVGMGIVVFMALGMGACDGGKAEERAKAAESSAQQAAQSYEKRLAAIDQQLAEESQKREAQEREAADLSARQAAASASAAQAAASASAAAAQASRQREAEEARQKAEQKAQQAAQQAAQAAAGENSIQSSGSSGYGQSSVPENYLVPRGKYPMSRMEHRGPYNGPQVCANAAVQALKSGEYVEGDSLPDMCHSYSVTNHTPEPGYYFRVVH